MITATAASTDPRLLEWRHQLHRIPETAFNEHATSHYVASVLRSLGFDVATGIGGTGVVGSLARGSTGRAVALRCELDALPIAEDSGVEYTSTRPGTMHACGHDGHMAMLLGAAAVLAEQGGFDGTVRVLFQPAEEPGRGAQAMIDHGLLERYPPEQPLRATQHAGRPAGQPVHPHRPDHGQRRQLQHPHPRPPRFTAAPGHRPVDHRRRGHHRLQHVVARNVDPVAPAVLSCTDLQADGTRNAIPSNVHLTGDTRSFDPNVQALLEQRIRATSNGIASAHDATYTHEFGPTVNDAERTRRAEQAARTALGPERVDSDCDPIMASEDFGVLAQALAVSKWIPGSVWQGPGRWHQVHGHGEQQRGIEPGGELGGQGVGGQGLRSAHQWPVVRADGTTGARLVGAGSTARS